MNREEELRKALDEIRSELSEITTKRELEKNKDFVGKFFKYKNSYGGDNPNERWWFYIFVEGMSDDGDLFGFTFQTDYKGKIEIEEEDYISTSLFQIEISKREFWDAFDVMLSKIKMLSYR